MWVTTLMNKHTSTIQSLSNDIIDIFGITEYLNFFFAFIE